METNQKEPHFVGDIMQMDLADFHKEPEFDKSTKTTYTFALVCVDSFSRFGMVAALPGRKSDDVIEGLKQIFTSTGFKPVSCMADPAGEHVSAKTRKFFASMGIHLYFTTSKIHCPAAEVREKKRRFSLYFH